MSTMSASPSMALVIFFSLSPGANSQERAVEGWWVTGMCSPVVIPAQAGIAGGNFPLYR
jgi:hypothetical protein